MIQLGVFMQVLGCVVRSLTRRIFKAGIVVFFYSASVGAAEVNLSDYELIFSDEFNGPTLDSSKWNTRFFWGPYVPINNEEQVYIDTLGLNADFDFSPFSIADGVLTISAVPVTNARPAPNQPPATDSLWASNPDLNFNQNYDEQSVNYLSGIITSADSYNATHGYFEARLKFPKGRGLWPAFWLLNYKYVENFPEIDIVEFLGHKPNTVHHTLHYVDINEGWSAISTPTYETVGPDYSADFHTYGVAWDPKQIRFLVDGKVVRTVDESEFHIAGQAMYMLLNLAVGGAWPGSPDDETTFPADFEIDYVRAYEHKSVGTITPGKLAENYVLMFSDEFNATSLNEEKWNTSFLWGPYLQINNEEQVYIDTFGLHSDHPVDPFEVSNGTLKIKADQIDESELPVMPPASDPIWQQYGSYQNTTNYRQVGGWTPSYSSGILTSYDNFKFVNGYIEARIKMPSGAGLWPAFWLLNGYYVGPQPEMDIVEVRGGEPGTTHHTYHYSNNVGELISSPTLSNPAGFSISDFHTYGFQWDSERMVWYVDGEIVKVLVGSEVSDQLSYVLLNLAVGGNFVGDVASDSVPANMEIDWVRVYQQFSDPIVVDTDAPDTSISFLGTVGLGSIEISGTASDETSAVLEVRVRVTRQADGFTWTGSEWIDQSNNWNVAQGTDNWSYQIPIEQPGRYTVYAYSIDTQGNIERWPDGRPNKVFTAELDDVLVPNTTIAAVGTIAPGLLEINGTAQDESSAIAKVYIRIRRLTDGTSWNGDTWIAGQNVWNEAEGAEVWSYEVPIDVPGIYRAHAYSIDTSGNIERWADGLPSILFTAAEIDDSPPTTDINPISPMSVGNVSLSGTASDELSPISRVLVRIRRLSDNHSWNGSNWVNQLNIWKLAEGTEIWNYTLPIQDSGDYRISVYSVDAAGNVERWSDGRSETDFIVN